MTMRVHIHSDCSFFAGCENMLVNFFNDPVFIRDNEISFTYRRTKKYDEGLHARCSCEGIGVMPLRLWDMYDMVSCLPASIRGAVLEAGKILLLNYVIIAVNALQIYRSLRGRSIDILHVNNGGYPGANSCLAAVLAGRAAGIKKIVFVVNNMVVPYKRPSRWVERPIDIAVVACTTRFVTGSAFAAQALQRVLSIPAPRVIHLPNGVAQRPVTETRTQVLDRYGIRHDAVVAVTVAILERRKGHRVLLEALRKIAAGGDERLVPVLVIEGHGPEEDSLKAFVARYCLGRFLRFGTEKNVFNLMAAADMVVLPSLSNEDFPNVVLEAMSLGKPVIASTIAGTPEQIDTGRTGLLVDPGNPEVLADARDELGRRVLAE
ncbi:MAG: glycosyltransferase family 4 protein, partial [Elusimicrobiota bacterium]